MADATWMLYGANGYTGELIADVAARRGLKPILAGRREDAVRAVAQRHGFEYRVFPLDNPDAIAAQLDGVSAIALAAGPFSATSKPVVAACLASKTHYLDITGEIAVFEACHRRDAEARAAGIALMPGVGFDVVPTDCVAATLAARMPDAVLLELAFAGDSGFSQGTAKTMVEGLGYGGAIRKDGVIVRVPTAWRVTEIPFRDRERTCVSIPWGDVSTAYYSTGIGHIVVYTYMPKKQLRSIKMVRPLLGALRWKPLQNMVKRRIERTVKGPSAEDRKTARSQVWGRVTGPDNRTLDATLVCLEGYRLTAETTVESVVRLLDSDLSGALTPSMAFGAGYIAEFDHCDLQVDEREEPARQSA
jgi:saccharopine dehydrogenase (NAD+, L-lysine-forming)